MDTKAQLITWLRDAHAMEREMEMVLSRHLQDARELPAVREKLQQHLDETREHGRLVDDCLRLRDATPSTAKSTLAGLLGAMQGMSTVMFSDQLLKNALTDYAMEHLEIGCYSSLIATAEEGGFTAIANTCSEILRE